MLWRDPIYLWLLPLVIAFGVLLIVLLRRRAAALRAFAEAGVVERLIPDVDRRRTRRRMLVRIAALALLVVALAGPKWGFHWQEVKREGIDIIVALDTSRSMLATDVKPNRIERAKFAVLDLLPLLQGDRIGLVAFAGTAFLECPLTLDYAAFERSLRAVDVGIIPRGGTALARAIDTSLDAFEARQGKYEALILITDGEDHEGDVKAAAQRAAERGVKIYTVGIGTSEGELLPLGAGGFVKDRSGQVVKSRLSEEPLKDIALATGGAYVQGLGSSLGLDQVFREHIATMERREVGSALERRYEERFQIPLALALLLLAVEWLMPVRRAAAATRRAWRWRGAGEQRAAALLVFLLLPALVGWLDPPGDRAAEGNNLFAAGKYEDAAGKYGEGLIDAPESPLLQFNLAAALYKQGKYDDAIKSLEKAAASGKPEWVARANYNIGNAYYRLGANAEEKDPQAALSSYEQALAAYKRSMVADAADSDVKFNHEFVSRKRDELKKRLEEQQQKQDEQRQQQEQQKQEQQKQEQQKQEQQKQEQQKQEQGEQQQQPDQQQQQDQQDQQQAEQQQQPDQPQDQQEQQQQQAGQDQRQQQGQDEEQAREQADQQQGDQQQAEQQKQAEEQQAGADAAQPEGGEPDQRQQAATGRTSDAAPPSDDARAAQAVLDTARSEELSPDDMARAVGVAGIGEPAQDW